MEQKLTKVQQFWKDIRNLSYSSAVWGYKYNEFHKIAEKYNIWKKCCGRYWDVVDYKFCPRCGKELKNGYK